MKSNEVSFKTRSTPASLTIQGQVTKDTTVKWSIATKNLIVCTKIIQTRSKQPSNCLLSVIFSLRTIALTREAKLLEETATAEAIGVPSVAK